MIVLVLGIAQVPALLVTLPVIAYIWMSGDYGTAAAVLTRVLLFVAGMLDNVLKPLMLGRGVDAPMPVILLGALGGMATAGILGMFVGATLLALGYQIFMGWVATNPTRGRRSANPGLRAELACGACRRIGVRTRAVGLAAAALLGACTTRRARLQAPQVPWLADWTGGSLESLAADTRGARSGHAAGVVAQLQRSGARPADRRGAARQSQRAHRRPAHHGGARPARHRRQHALPAGAAGHRRRAAASARARRGAPDTTALTVSAGLAHQLGARLLGQVQAQHRGRGRRLPRQHRPVRRPAGADGRAGGQPVLLDPHRRGAAA